MSLIKPPKELESPRLVLDLFRECTFLAQSTISRCRDTGTCGRTEGVKEKEWVWSVGCISAIRLTVVTSCFVSGSEYKASVLCWEGRVIMVPFSYQCKEDIAQCGMPGGAASPAVFPLQIGQCVNHSSYLLFQAWLHHDGSS